MNTDVLILGAGVCGLAAAYRLLQRRPELSVTLLEQEDRPGGLARSLTVNGQVADLGPHRIFTELPDVQEFLEDLVGEQLETVRRASRMWLRGKFIEYPPKTAEIVRHLGVGTVASAGVSWARGKASRALSREASSHESFESLMVPAFGRELYDLLVGPYAEKVWKLDPDTLHGDIARVRVSAGGLDQMIKKLFVREKEGEITAVKKFYYIAGGVEKLVTKLRDGVEARGGKVVLVREVVDATEQASGSWDVSARNRESGAVETYSAPQMVSTIPVGDLLGMLLKARPNENVDRARCELRYIANYLICVVVNRPSVSDSQWLYFPERDTLFNRGYEPKNFHKSMGSDDQSMIVLEVTTHDNDPVKNMGDDELIEKSLNGLENVGLVQRAEVVATHVHRIPMTYPIYDLSYRERLARIAWYLERFPQLISAGRQGLFLHNNMDHSIHMGFRAAECFLGESENPAGEFYKDIRRFQQFRIVD